MRFFGSVVLLLLALKCATQTYNYSFEEYTAIPTELGQWPLISGWTNAGSDIASPDYFHINGNTQTDLPETPYAFVTPISGSSIVGLRVAGRYGDNSREYLCSRLQNTCEVGQTYKLSFRVTNGTKTSVTNAGIAVNHIGIALTENEPVQQGISPLPLTPQCIIDQVVSHENWVQYSYTLKVERPYRFLTLGLMGNDDLHDFVSSWGDDSQFAYYFFDDVMLEKVSHEENICDEKYPIVNPDLPSPLQPEEVSDFFFLPNSFSPNQDGSNEYFGPVSHIIKQWEFYVFSKWGDLVYYSNQASDGWDGTYNGLDCPDGSYIWQLNFERVLDSGKKIPLEFKGLVNVIR